jgi:hypothetical protein
MIADYCWPIARDDPSREHSKTSRTHKFYGKERPRNSNVHFQGV